MTGTNHALTGALIATVVSSPFISLPLAFGSHFVLDALPHFGENPQKRTVYTRIVWVLDACLLALLLLFVLDRSLSDQALILAGAVAALSPDFVWIYRLLFVDSKYTDTKNGAPKNRFNIFHASIQKYETRAGIVVEVFAAIVLFSLFVSWM